MYFRRFLFSFSVFFFHILEYFHYAIFKLPPINSLHLWDVVLFSRFKLQKHQKKKRNSKLKMKFHYAMNDKVHTHTKHTVQPNRMCEIFCIFFRLVCIIVCYRMYCYTWAWTNSFDYLLRKRTLIFTFSFS